VAVRRRIRRGICIEQPCFTVSEENIEPDLFPPQVFADGTKLIDNSAPIALWLAMPETCSAASHYKLRQKYSAGYDRDSVFRSK
jgi:hypothetical protein